MIDTTRPLFVLDHFRVPYTLGARPFRPGFDRLSAVPRAESSSREVIWPVLRGVPVGLSFMGVPFVGRCASVQELRAVTSGRSWEEGEQVLSSRGEAIAAVSHADDGSVLLPFDPDELIWGTLRERYVQLSALPGEEAARRMYYGLRRALPRTVQLALRRKYASVQTRKAFPAWPIEARLQRVLSWLLQLVESVAGQPIPWIAPWPAGTSWAVVLTHDVEHADGYEFVDQVLAVEEAAGVHSAWYFVPERDYRVSAERIESLLARGCEVGLHGLRHDGRDLDRAVFLDRLPKMAAYAERWGAVGFRSPSTLRDWELMPKIGLDYDSSYSDVARYEPIAGGSCTWFPFFIDDLVELPITMPMDHTLFELVGERDESVWVEKALFLKNEGGMALLLTHPDYLIDRDRLQIYARFVERIAQDPSAWLALPREISSWWRARAATVPVRDGEQWSLAGPAADRGRVMIGAPLPSLAAAN